jgi:hypothetical protein
MSYHDLFFARQASVGLNAPNNGVASAQLALVAAVFMAFTTGKPVLAAPGTYLSTDTIPYLHQVKWIGHKVFIKRGTDLFCVTPDNETNKLYVAVTGGDDAKDGLSANEPMLTRQAAGSALYNYPWSMATYQIQHSAETFTDTALFNAPAPTPYRVQFLGSPKLDGQTPTTIFTSPGGAGKTGIYVTNRYNLHVEDIFFMHYRDGASPAVSGNSTGVTADKWCEVYSRNCFYSDCDNGIDVENHGRLLVQAGKIDACAQGIRCIFHVTYTIGYNGSAASSGGDTGVAITNCTGSGILVQENTTGHADFTYISGCANGVSLNVNSRLHLKGSNVNTNTNGISSSISCNWFDNTVTPNTFATNTLDWNMPASFEEGAEGALSGYGLFNKIDTSALTTQSATRVNLFTYTIKGKRATRREAAILLNAFGNVLGTAGAKTIVLSFGGVDIATLTLSTAANNWSIHCKIRVRTGTGSPSQKALIEASGTGVTPILTILTSLALDMNTDQIINVDGSVANTADTLRMQDVEVEVRH